MPIPLTHDLKIDTTRDAQAAQDFVVGLRKFVLNDLAATMRGEFEDNVRPTLERKLGKVDLTQDDIHKAMRSNDVFQLYSSARYNAQEMSWRSVIPDVAEGVTSLEDKAAAITQAPKGSLSLNLDLDIPDNVSQLDVHLMPGGYVSQSPMLSGAVYDNGLTVFTAGLVGPHIDDIGQSMARYVAHKFPDLDPKSILDCGCTIGHHSVPWAQVFPQADVHAIDVSGSMVTYGHARAESLGVAIHFHQMDATALQFKDNSFEVMFSSQFLHELSLKDIAQYFREAYRVLKPGGLLITMELPPNKLLEAYDQFYLDWDCYYNREPYYRQFRDANIDDLIEGSGFKPDDYFQFTVPQYFTISDDAFKADLQLEHAFDDKIGQMKNEFRYFGFGLQK